MEHGKKLITDEMQEDGVELNTDLNYMELDEPTAMEEDTEEGEKYFSKSAKNSEKLPDDYWQNFDKIIPKSHQKKSAADLAVTVGDQIKHKKWGVGVVEQIEDAPSNDRMLIIRFQKLGTKKLLQSVAPIEKI